MTVFVNPSRRHTIGLLGGLHWPPLGARDVYAQRIPQT